MKLAKKLLAIQSGITPVAKDGHNEFHNYDYATEAGFLAVLRPLLVQNDVVMMSSVLESQIIKEFQDNKGKLMFLTWVKMEFVLIDAESGEEYRGFGQGYGLDNADKGIYKAQTGATKYFLAKCFLIPTGDDPENETPTTKVEKSTTKATGTPSKLPKLPGKTPPPVSMPPQPDALDQAVALATAEATKGEPFPDNVPLAHGACTDVTCNGLFVERKSAKGKILACSNYPKCKIMKPL